MVYIAFTYSILLLLSTYYGYKKGMGISRISLVISSLLFLSTFLHLIFLNTFFKTLISILLLLISVSFFHDRKMSKKQIHYTHHCIRLIFHVFIIYFLYHQFKIKLLPEKNRVKPIVGRFHSVFCFRLCCSTLLMLNSLSLPMFGWVKGSSNQFAIG